MLAIADWFSELIRNSGEWILDGLTREWFTQAALSALAVSLVWTRTWIFKDMAKKIRAEGRDTKDVGKLRNRQNIQKRFIVSGMLIALGGCIFIAPVFKLFSFWLVAILAAAWERRCYATADMVEIRVRKGDMGRVSGSEGILSEELGNKLPWEDTEAYSLKVENHNVSIEFEAGSGMVEGDPGWRPDESHIGLVTMEVTVQDRVGPRVLDASGRLRAPELSAEVLDMGIKERAEGMIVDAGVKTPIDAVLGSKKALELMVQCRMALHAMPHEETEEDIPDITGDDLEKYSLKERELWEEYNKPFNELPETAPGGLKFTPIPGASYPYDDKHLIQFYTENRRAILRGRLNLPMFSRGQSDYEKTYGRDVLKVFNTKVLPALAGTKEALDGPRKNRALRDGIQVYLDAGYDKATAQRLAKAGAGISDVQEIDMSGDGGNPIVNVGRRGGE